MRITLRDCFTKFWLVIPFSSRCTVSVEWKESSRNYQLPILHMKKSYVILRAPNIYQLIDEKGRVMKKDSSEYGLHRQISQMTGVKLVTTTSPAGQEIVQLYYKNRNSFQP